MKDDSTRIITTGNVNSLEAIECSFDEEGMGQLMEILSNMYGNAPRAALREYAWNGLDSHAVAGTTRPVEITLPSVLQPSLLIRDYGTGLDRDEILNVFSKYGKSTKRGTNKEVGKFGIGSKAAFTMGQQFIVTGIKNGRKVVALFALNEENIGTANILHDEPSDEATGVLISMGAEDVETMAAEAASLFSTAAPGSFLVNGVEPESIFDRAYKVNDETYTVPNHDGTIRVVMGGIAYQVSTEILLLVAKKLAGTDAATMAEALSEWNSDTSVLFKVEIGDVVIKPDREMLRDAGKTVNTLASLITGLSQDLTASVQAKVDSARSMFEANQVIHQAVHELSDFNLQRKNLTYGGVSMIPLQPVLLEVIYLRPKSWRSEAKVIGIDPTFTVDGIRSNQILVVTEVPSGETNKVSRYAKRFLETNTLGVKWIVVSEKTQGAFGWFEYGIEHGARTMTLVEYRKTLREMSQSNPRTKNEPSYSTGFVHASRDLADRDLLTDIIGWGKDIIIVHESAARINSIARRALEDYTIVVLMAQQSEAALRKRVAEDGSVEIEDRPYQEIVSEYASTWVAQITQDELDALGAYRWLDSSTRVLARGWSNLRGALDGDDVPVKHPVFEAVADDVALAEMVYNSGIATDVRRQEIETVLGLTENGPVVPEFDAKIPEIYEVFPLLQHVSTYYLTRFDYMRRDAIEYINSKV